MLIYSNTVIRDTVRIIELTDQNTVTDPAPDTALFVSDLQDANKQTKFFCCTVCVKIVVKVMLWYVNYNYHASLMIMVRNRTWRRLLWLRTD
jgi:hypothetical protein